MIAEKYCSKSLSVLTPDEILLETLTPKQQYNIELFLPDIEFSKLNKLNISRIIRHKFHEWLREKTMEV